MFVYLQGCNLDGLYDEYSTPTYIVHLSKVNNVDDTIVEWAKYHVTWHTTVVFARLATTMSDRTSNWTFMILFAAFKCPCGGTVSLD